MSFLRTRWVMVTAALKLKALRERTSPHLTVRAMADKLGMPLSSYSRYETAAKFKKPYLPLKLARDIATILADHGVASEEVMALAGVAQDEMPAPSLSAGEEHLLDSFRQLTPTQRRLLQQMADQMKPSQPASGHGASGTTLHRQTTDIHP